MQFYEINISYDLSLHAVYNKQGMLKLVNKQEKKNRQCYLSARIILLQTVTLTNEITANKHFSLKIPTITSHGSLVGCWS